MQEKLEEILSNAKDWLTAAEIADKGKWRSASHVGLALKQMDSVEHRTSPTKKMGNGIPAKEYKLADKSFDSDVASTKSASISSKLADKKSLAAEMPTDKECCNAAKVVATTAGSEVATLNKTIATLREEIAGHLDWKERLEDDIRRHIKRAEAAERNRDDTQKQSEENRRLFLAAISDLASINRALELDPDDGGAAPILEAIDEYKVMLAEETNEVVRLRAENLALKTLNESMPGFGAAYEAQKAKKQTQPRRPFSVTGLVGFHTGSQKVTLFLDRRLNARSVTLPADKLAQLAEMAGAAA